LLVCVGLSGCFGPNSIEVKISYSGSWSGAIMDDDGSRSIEGYGTESYSVSGGIVSATAQKMDSYGTITIQILADGKVVEQQSSSASYGVVSVSHSF
jgi:hypothetical protein